MIKYIQYIIKTLSRQLIKVIHKYLHTKQYNYENINNQKKGTREWEEKFFVLQISILSSVTHSSVRLLLVLTVYFKSRKIFEPLFTLD